MVKKPLFWQYQNWWFKLIFKTELKDYFTVWEAKKLDDGYFQDHQRILRVN